MAPGNFFATAENIHLENGHILRGKLKKVDGSWVPAHINLDEHIGNQNGKFAWNSKGFHQSAKDVSCHVEGQAHVCVLRAKLRNNDGEHVDSDLNLAERLSNHDGHFVWQ